MQLSDEEKRELAEVYERAAEAIERDGWFGYGGSANTPTSSKCMIIAIDAGMKALGKQWWDGEHEPQEFAAKVLELENPGCGALILWNDDPTRTADEVINTLHALANKLR